MEKTKRILWLALFGALVVLSAAGAATDQYVQIENVQVTPASILPGDTFTITFDVRNLLKDDLKYVYVRFAPDANFKLIGSDTFAYQSVIPTREKVTATFNLKVGGDALADVYSLPFSITSESKIVTAATGAGSIYTTSVSVSQTEYARVEVSGRSNLVLSLAGSQPGMMSSDGKESAVTLKVFNNGSDTAKNVWLFPRDTEAIRVGSASESVFLGEIKPKNSATAAISIEILESGSGNYVLPVGMSFSDKRARYDDTYGMELKMEDRATFEVPSRQRALMAGKNDQALLVNLKNKGNAAAEDIRLAVVAEYPLTTSGRNSFIARIEPGMEGEAHFTLDVDSKAAAQSHPVELLISWREGEIQKSAVRYFSVEVERQKTSYQILVAAAVMAVLAAALVIRRFVPKSKKPVKAWTRRI